MNFRLLFYYDILFTLFCFPFFRTRPNGFFLGETKPKDTFIKTQKGFQRN